MFGIVDTVTSLASFVHIGMKYYGNLMLFNQPKDLTQLELYIIHEETLKEIIHIVLEERGKEIAQNYDNLDIGSN